MEGKTLVLNEGGIGERFRLDLDIGGLYLSQKESNAQTIIEEDQPMAVYLETVSGIITSDRMIEAVDEGFQNPPKEISNRSRKTQKIFTICLQ